MTRPADRPPANHSRRIERRLRPIAASAAQAAHTWAEKFESFEWINSIRETNENFDSCNSCKRLGTSRLLELHEWKFSFVSRIEFIRSKLSNFSAHVYGGSESAAHTAVVTAAVTVAVTAASLRPRLQLRQPDPAGRSAIGRRHERRQLQRTSGRRGGAAPPPQRPASCDTSGAAVTFVARQAQGEVMTMAGSCCSSNRMRRLQSPTTSSDCCSHSRLLY